MRLFLLCLSFLTSRAQADQSIADLPQLGALMVHHFDCDLMLVIAPDNDSQEAKFSIPGSLTGQTGNPISVALAGDTLAGSANSQMLELEWRRGGKLVARATTMIQISTTKAYVLLVSDPGNEGSQASLNCTAVTFAELNRGRP